MAAWKDNKIQDTKRNLYATPPRPKFLKVSSCVSGNISENSTSFHGIPFTSFCVILRWVFHLGRCESCKENQMRPISPWNIRIYRSSTRASTAPPQHLHYFMQSKQIYTAIIIAAAYKLNVGCMLCNESTGSITPCPSTHNNMCVRATSPILMRMMKMGGGQQLVRSRYLLRRSSGSIHLETDCWNFSQQPGFLRPSGWSPSILRGFPSRSTGNGSISSTSMSPIAAAVLQEHSVWYETSTLSPPAGAGLQGVQWRRHTGNLFFEMCINIK